MENNEDMLDQLRVLQRFTGGVDQLIAMDMGLGGSWVWLAHQLS